MRVVCAKEGRGRPSERRVGVCVAIVTFLKSRFEGLTRMRFGLLSDWLSSHVFLLQVASNATLAHSKQQISMTKNDGTEKLKSYITMTDCFRIERKISGKKPSAGDK